MQKLAQILIDQSHRQAWAVDYELAAQINPANPADASYAKMAEAASLAGFGVSSFTSAPITKELLAGFDVFVLPHASTDEWEKTIGVGTPALSESEIAVLKEFVAAGGGLVVLGETDQPKYGNNFSELTEVFGVKIANQTVQDSIENFKDVATWIKGDLQKSFEHDLSFKVKETAFYRAGVLEILDGANAEVVAQSSPSAYPA